MWSKKINKYGVLHPAPSRPKNLPGRRVIIFLGVLIVAFQLSKAAPAAPAEKPKIQLAFPGSEFPIPYEKYGTFENAGTNNYKYKITDRERLVKAAGEGVYPNTVALFNDPAYQAWKKANPGDITPWSSVQSGDPKKDFYVWATAKDVGPAAKLFFTAQALAEAGLVKQALKAYYAILVHFPKEPCWAADHSFVWYVGDAALGRIDMLTTEHQNLGWRLQGAVFKVKNGNDTDLKNDEFILNPGKWVRYKPEAVDVATLKVVNQRGLGKVRLVQYENKHWQLLVEGKPFTVQAVTYSPITVGEHISDAGNNWMAEDADENGRPDAPYDAWIDANQNGRQDENEKAVGDFQLMKDMGVNAIRLYRTSSLMEYDPSEFKKETLRDLSQKYGIRVIMGDFLGAYTVGSGADWEAGTDYTDPVQLENMKRLVKSYVQDHRSEPYVLMWLLGNENLMPADYSGVNATRTRASMQVEAYLRFVNEVAQMIHQIDPDHPVAVGNLGVIHVEEYGMYAPDVDIFGVNSYNGSQGFASVWRKAREAYDRPVLITEYGCDSFDSRVKKENEQMQADYHEGNWGDIERHMAGQATEGNAIGGVVFEYLDEWWKSHNGGGWDAHDRGKDSAMAFPDGWSSEEWYGLMSQGEGNDSPFLRRPKKAYYLYRDKLWKAVANR